MLYFIIGLSLMTFVSCYMFIKSQPISFGKKVPKEVIFLGFISIFSCNLPFFYFLPPEIQEETIIQIIFFLGVFILSTFVFCWNSYEIYKKHLYPHGKYPKGILQPLISGFWSQLRFGREKLFRSIFSAIISSLIIHYALLISETFWEIAIIFLVFMSYGYFMVNMITKYRLSKLK